MSYLLYAAELKDGRTKVGITKAPERRMDALRSKLGITRYRFSRPVPSGSYEKALLARLGRMAVMCGPGREIFSVPFGAACTLIRQVAYSDGKAPLPEGVCVPAEVPDNMTLDDAKLLLGVSSDYALAKALGVTRQAVSLWRNDFPQQRRWQVEALVKGKGGK